MDTIGNAWDVTYGEQSPDDIQHLPGTVTVKKVSPEEIENAIAAQGTPVKRDLTDIKEYIFEKQKESKRKKCKHIGRR